MSARDELYAYGAAAFETGVPPVVHEYLTKGLNAYKAEVLREAAEHLAKQAGDLWMPGRTAHTIMHADADELRRMADEAEAGTPAP